ncbi:MAG: aromatic amino acid transport family protein [Simkaniaceae bacterium]
MALKISKTTGSIFLVAGTSIGAGMLALPISTGTSGIVYSCLLFLAAFLFMLMTLFLLLEVTLWSKKPGANLISIAREQLGVGGEVIAWASFLLLLYSVAAAYISAGGSLLNTVINWGFGVNFSPKVGIGIFIALFGCFVVFETKAVETVNRFFVFSLIAVFFALIFFTAPLVSTENFPKGTTTYLWSAVPIVVLSFTSHIIVPSLKTYLGGNIKRLRRVLWIGSLIPLIFYLVWEFLILGVLPPSGEFSLEAIAKQRHPVAALTLALHSLLDFPIVSLIVGLFSFFALATSFFGVSLSLYDFLADGFRIKKNAAGRIILLFLMFAPPLLFSLFYPKGFMLALSYAGVFVAVLYGLLPAAMVWKGRYVKHIKEPYQVPGGRIIPIIAFLGALAIILLQIAATNGWIPSL